MPFRKHTKKLTEQAVADAKEIVKEDIRLTTKEIVDKNWNLFVSGFAIGALLVVSKGRIRPPANIITTITINLK